MDKGQLKIDLLGASFTIQADEDSVYLDSLYMHYKAVVSQVEQNSGVKDPLKVAIISGILLADELQKEKQKIGNLPQAQTDLLEMGQYTQRMLNSINSAIDDRSDTTNMR
ncbi:cell division protein ZapA [Treponema phagedenis]|uniref:Cell division protein ZapA n=1 Tax=Treponema phagedenis TaxID=162 RepID=A0A0B7GXB3_TREPH|nr:cell division protein ZapA [Treponema phagedenis]EFW37888.1 hypothetical protein HMPREF9554_01610 [Treponema phagedenis F0421]NVP25299.1 cell division protein ZapA [Treponema phagedenis]QEJ96272.1 cell division protein ZapA [Treponema phagedenis]QEJ97023.1 cell division protein ZapA [Treponema phagedenis]QEK00050.1 cell division protein ZapA [Treponema phagedenis]